RRARATCPPPAAEPRPERGPRPAPPASSFGGDPSEATSGILLCERDRHRPLGDPVANAGARMALAASPERDGHVHPDRDAIDRLPTGDQHGPGATGGDSPQGGGGGGPGGR